MKQVKKGYKLRYSNLSKAWTFVEAHVSVAMENYRKTVDHLQKRVDSQIRDHGAGNTSTKGASKTKKK